MAQTVADFPLDRLRACGVERVFGHPGDGDALTDPELPPLPPHVTLEQARSLASAVLRGDPEAQRIGRESLRGTLEKLLPPRQRERP